MRRAVRLFLATLLLVAGALAGAGPAIAAPADPYTYSQCFSDDGYQVCFAGRGVVKEQRSASGNLLFKASGTFTFTVRENGRVIEEASGRDNFVLLLKRGELHVYHDNGKGRYTFDGVTCTYRYNTTYANGELRHQLFDSRCTP